jgi:hypothetical protein
LKGFTRRAKAWLRTFPTLVRAKRRIDSIRHGSDYLICNSLPLFAPYSSGSYRDRAALRLQAANQTLPLLVHLLEIGLGTNNTDVVSNMGSEGVPDASLRAFRDYLPNARIYGAGIDKRILFEESRIKTYFADQTDLAAAARLRSHSGPGLGWIAFAVQRSNAG